MEIAHLLLHVLHVVVGDTYRPADRGVHVVVELPAVAGEALGEGRRLLHPELGRLNREPARVVLERGLDRAGGSDGHGQLRRAELRQRHRELQHDAAAGADLQCLRRERDVGGRNADRGDEADVLAPVLHDRNDEEGRPRTAERPA